MSTGKKEGRVQINEMWSVSAWSAWILTCDLRDRWLIKWLSSWGAAGPRENWVVKPRYPPLPGEALAIRTNVRRKVTSDCSHKISKISRHSSSSDTSSLLFLNFGLIESKNFNSWPTLGVRGYSNEKGWTLIYHTSWLSRWSSTVSVHVCPVLLPWLLFDDET